MGKKRRIITWTLTANDSVNGDFNRNIRKYHDKIYSIGLHEFGATREGYLYSMRWGLSRPSLFGRFFNADGTPTTARGSIPITLEQHILDYPDIQWYLQITAFGWNTVGPLLDNNVVNAEGRLPQDQLCYELNLLFDQWETSRGSGRPLNLTGLEMDIEASLTGVGGTGHDQRFLDLLQKVKTEVVIPRQLKYRVNAYAMWGRGIPTYYRFHNYELFAEAVGSDGKPLIDEVQIMTYDFAWSGSAPGASTPVYWFRQVADWARQAFDPSYNPNSKLTMANIYFGSAGYGVRWQINEETGLRGTNVTYRNLIGWQNGYYRHFSTSAGPNGGTLYTYHNQEYLQQNSFEDLNSKNQVMYPHVYDILSAKYGNLVGESTQRGYYNSKNYATTFSRSQQASFEGVASILNTPAEISGKITPLGTLNRNVNGVGHQFEGYSLQKQGYVPKLESGGVACALEEDTSTLITYRGNVTGRYKVIALIGFPWYSSAKVGGSVNGQSFSFGDSLPDYYPLHFKQSHFADIGTYNFNGNVEIVVDGDLSDMGTQVYGFVLCEDFSHNFEGGSIDYDADVRPQVFKDGQVGEVPNDLVLSMEILRQDARPAIIWEDRFEHYMNDEFVTTNGLSATNYYQRHGTYTVNGMELDTSAGYERCISTRVLGYTEGTWIVERDAFNVVGAKGRGKLVFNRIFNGNLQVEATVRIENGNEVGVWFGGTSATDGYSFTYNYGTRKLRLSRHTGTGTTVLVEQDYTGPVLGERITLKAQLFEGKVYGYVGTSLRINGAIVPKTKGGSCGVISPGDIRVYVLGIGSLDRWEPMEKFEVEVDGVKTLYGIEPRTITDYDEWGYLRYSGINELNIRNNPVPLPKDYMFHVQRIEGFEGKKNVKIKFKDPGLWYANCYVGDAEGCSIIYTGDSSTFNILMNIATEEYGANGIGLWTLGQEDPQIFDTVPDIK